MATSEIEIRAYSERDAPEIVRLFHETVRSVNLADYSQDQVQAWAPEIPDPSLWHARMSRRCTLVAEESGEVVAFAELEEDGHLDMFYCRKDAVRRGVGSLLYKEIEAQAREQNLEHITTEASITARPFFERHGFHVVREQKYPVRGIEMTNFVMDKSLRR